MRHSVQEPVALFLAREPFELEEVRSLLHVAGIRITLYVPGSGAEGLYGPAVGAPATVCVARADLERARAVLAEAWGSVPELPD